MTQPLPRPTHAYKLLSASEWSSFQQSKTFSGSGIDLKDGYIHLSTASQTAETYLKYFSDQSGIVLVEVDLQKLGEKVNWEVSRGDQLFPHVYGEMGLDDVGRVWEDVDEGKIRREVLREKGEA